MNDMKTYVLMLSKVFPATHPRKGEPTSFKMAFNNARLCAKCQEKPKGMCMGECVVGYIKRHTIRANYDLWKKRFEQIAAGEAVLSVRQWTAAPYRSKQVEIARLTREDGIGLQCLRFDKSRFLPHVDYKPIGIGNLANNDGLSLEDWREWFKDYDLSKPLAIIHFTKFRY